MCDILPALQGDVEVDPADLLQVDQMSCNEVYGIYSLSEPSLLSMPVEIFLKICSFLDADFISHTVSKVCRRFSDILSDITLWRCWVNRRIKKRYPALPHLKVWNDTGVNWEEACINLDKETKKWSNATQRMRHVVVKDVHFASVDSVLLVNNGELCVSGGRDRGLALWKVSSIKPEINADNSSACINRQPTRMRADAHLGWVWDLAANSQTNATLIYSASWDNTVKAWDLNADLACVETFECGMSALSVVTSDGLILAGLYSKKILIFDNRVGPRPVDSYKAHSGPILALDTHEEMVASVSEDKTLAIWDRRAGKLLASQIRLPGEKQYPVSLNWSPAALYIGDSKGTLHLVDPEEYTYQDRTEIWEQPSPNLAFNKITGIHQGLGSMILCSDKGEIKFMYPSYPPVEYASLRSSTVDITKLQYQNDILVVGTCDSALEFWIPVDREIIEETA